MKVSSRIVLSVGILMLLAVAGLGYQLSIVGRMQRINDELSSVDFEAARLLLGMKQRAEQVRLGTSRYFVVSDPQNRSVLGNALASYIEAFESDLRQLETGLHSWESPEEVALLSTAWIDYQAQLERARRTVPESGTDELPLGLEVAIDQLRRRIDASYEAVGTGITNQVQRIQTIGEHAETVSLAAAGLFIVVGATLAFLTLQAINNPLRQLTSGTRKISGGNFEHRLPVTGPLEFAELAKDFNAMSERLGELDQMKKDFVSHVSHELKAPLAAIRQTLAVTLEEIPGPVNGRQRKLLQLSRNSAERLTAMVANLLDVSRLEAGTMDYEMSRQDLGALVRNVIEEFALKAEERNIAIVVDANETAIPVMCDRDRMIQVVGNLVDNAIKFSPPDSEIRVAIVPAGSGVAVTVADRGPGIPDAHKKDVFLKFHQVKGGGKRAAGQGVGLGLAIAKNIVDAHHGRIWVEDNPQGGSVFRFELRVAQHHAAAKCV